MDFLFVAIFRAFSLEERKRVAVLYFIFYIYFLLFFKGRDRIYGLNVFYF